MGVVIKFILLTFLTLNQSAGSEKHQNNIYHMTNMTEVQEQLLDTTTNTNPENDLLPTQFPNSFDYDCDKNICISKCCPEGQMFVDQGKKCEDVSLYDSQDWKPSNLKNYSLVIKSIRELLKTHSSNTFVCFLYKANEFSLNDDGTIYLYQRETSFSHESYCIDNKLEDSKIEKSAIICSEWNQNKSLYDKVVDGCHTAGVALSTVSLFILVLIFIFTPHKLDLQKRCTFTCCGSLFIGFFILLINRTPVVKYISGNGCLTLGLLMQYFMLSFYFWLNITCFEIFRIIRGIFNLQSKSDLSKSIRRFSIYSVYCYGCPLLICALTITMQMIPLSSFPSSIRSYIIKPNINEGRCWLQDGKPQLVYYYSFEIFLHIVNAFFMGHTTYLLYKEKLIVTFCRRTSTVAIRTHEAVNHLDEFKQQMRIYTLYIFIWIMNCVTLIHRRNKIWRIVDIIVSLQGVFVVIFILYTSKVSLINPILKNISNAAREFSSIKGEEKSYSLTNIETSQISLNSYEEKGEMSPGGKNV